MEYKQIALKVDLNGKLRFDEYDLPYDREDEGEYVGMGFVATIYQTSSSDIWKRKLIDAQRAYANEQINKITDFVNKLNILECDLE